MPLIMNSLGEFVDPEPGCSYPKLAAIDPSRMKPDDEEWRTVGTGKLEKECPECGTFFRTSSNRRITCSAACSRKRKLRQQKEQRWARKEASRNAAS